MKRLFITAALLVAFVFNSLPTMAQPERVETSFTSALTGEVIDLGSSGEITFLPDDYDLSRGRAVAEEYIWFTYNWSNFELVLIQGDIDPADYFELTTDNMFQFYESFEIVEEAVTADHAWFIAHAVFQGSPLVVFYDYQLDALGDIDLVVMQFTAPDELAADMEFIQAEVTIGGNPILPDTDAPNIQSLVTETEADAIPGAATAEAAILDRLKPRIGESQNTTETSDDDVNEPVTDATVAPPSATATSGPDWVSMGLVSDTTWVSPTFGTTVDWDGESWVFPHEYEYAIYVNDDPAYDMLTIETTDGLGYAFVTVEDAGTATPLGLAEYWASPDYADSFEAEITVVETATTRSTASVIYETVNARDQPLYVVHTATFLEDGMIVYSQISAAPETISEVYGQYQNGVQVDDTPLDLPYTVDDIIEIAGD